MMEIDPSPRRGILHVPGLEIISWTGMDPSGAPVVLVHGAWHTAACWDEGFMARLASQGGDVHAVSLRGHGGSAGRRGLRRTRIRNYVEDLSRVVDALDGVPFLVGHSMGGYVARKYLEGRPKVAGAVLLAPVPRHGAARITWRFLCRSPIGWLEPLLTLSLWPLVSTPAKGRTMFLSAATNDRDADHHHARLQDESFAAYIDLLGLDRCRPVPPVVPVLVLGAEDDALFTCRQITGVARACGSVAEFYPGMAHDMMVEPGWERVADRVAGWTAASKEGYLTALQTPRPALGTHRTA